MDTPSILGRNLLTFPKVLQALQSSRLIASADSPTFEILYVKDFMPGDSQKQVNAMVDFVKDMSLRWKHAWRLISIKDDWRKTCPVGEKDLHEYLYNVSSREEF